MRRKNTADPYGASELKKVVSEILWVRTYILDVAASIQSWYVAKLHQLHQRCFL